MNQLKLLICLLSAHKGAHPFLWIIIPLAMVLLMVLAVLFFLLKRARKRELQEQQRIREEIHKDAEMNKEENTPVDVAEPNIFEKEFEGTPIVEPAIGYIRPRVNAIWLMGRLVLFDKKGMNITHLCSGKIKSLFFLIFLSSLFDDGISSDELSEVLWPGMDKNRTRNNRSVAMNHLRKIFDDMEGVALVYDKRNWKIRFTGPIYIDLVDLYNKRSDLQGNRLSIIGLYSMGNILQEVKMAELDKYIGAFEDEALELLTLYGNEYFDLQQYGLCNEIAGIIHNNINEINEYALELKLKALTRLCNSNKARQEYDNFCQRFKLLMDMEFTVPYKKLAGYE